MWSWIAQNLLSSLAGWLGLAGIIAMVCFVVAWFVPPLRRIALEIGVVAIAAATIYTKGNRDRAALEQKRKDEAVANAQKDYAEIDARADTPGDVSKRMRDGGF